MRAFMMYIDDWLSSKKIHMMDAQEERGYLRLLLREAGEADCGLPDDDNELAISSLLGRQWFKTTKDPSKRIGSKTSGQKLRDCFIERDGRLYNTRLLREWNHQREVNEIRRRNGSKGGRPKNHPVSVLEPNGLANHNQTETNDVLVSGCGVDSEQNPKKQKLYERYADFVEEWPENNRRGVDLGYSVWVDFVDRGIISETNIDSVFEGLARWKVSSQWLKDDGQFIPAIANTDITRPGWLHRRAWNDYPKPASEDDKWR